MAAASPPPPTPVQPADPTKPCPISSLPEDLWFHISDYAAASLEAEFVVCTARMVQHNSSLPLSPLDSKHDHVLTGVPINGKLYITDVPDLGSASFLGETHTFHTGAPADNTELDGPEADADDDDAQAAGLVLGNRYRVMDNGPWYSMLHREWGGEVDYTRTARFGARHRFFKEATADKLRLRLSADEMHVLEMRHCHYEIQTAQGQTGVPQMIQRLVNRKSQVERMDAVQYLRIPGASAVTKSGQLLVLALCKGLKIRSKLRIHGVLPLLTRLDVYNPPDDLATMEEPFHLRAQMSYSLNKWLVLAPHKWIAAMQHGAQGVLHIPTRREMQIAANLTRVDDADAENPRLAPGSTHHLHRASSHEWLANAPPLNVLMPAMAGRAVNVLENTSFRTIAPMMVHAFFTCRNRFANLTSDENALELLARARNDPMFREEFSLTGPHVVPAKEGKALKCSKTTQSAEGHFGMTPEMELFGGFAGV